MAVVLLLAGCGASASPGASNASSAPASTPTPGSPAPTSTPYPAPTLFTSPLYRYSVMLPAGWLVIPAETAWDGIAAIGHDDPIVDQLIGPQVPNRCKTVFLCGPIAWALAAPTTESVTALAAAMDAAEARDHPCPATPEQQDATTIDGEAALRTSKHCPTDGGTLLLRAITVHEGIGYYIWLQDPAHETAVEPMDHADFDALIAAIRLPD